MHEEIVIDVVVGVDACLRFLKNLIAVPRGAHLNLGHVLRKLLLLLLLLLSR